MKNYLLLITLGVLFSFVINESDLEKKLLEVYSTEQTQSILSDANRKNYFKTLVFDSFLIEDVTGSKIDVTQYPTIHSLELQDKNGDTNLLGIEEFMTQVRNGEFNPLKIRIERNRNTKKSFRLGSTPILFHLLSHKQINKLAKK